MSQKFVISSEKAQARQRLLSTPPADQPAISLAQLRRAGTAPPLRPSVPGFASYLVSAGPDDTAGHFPGQRVLLADDNATNRLVLQVMLTRLGVELCLVDSGQAALEAWCPNAFDVVMLDIAMPQMDGLSTLRHLRQRADAAGIALPPAFAVTANATAPLIEECKKAGFLGLVLKPASLADLSQALARVAALQPTTAP